MREEQKSNRDPKKGRLELAGQEALEYMRNLRNHDQHCTAKKVRPAGATAAKSANRDTHYEACTGSFTLQ